LSAAALRLRSLKRDLRRCYESQDGYPSLDAYGVAWCEIRREINPLEERILGRPATSWTDCVELAEVVWWGIAHRSGHSGNTYSDYPAAALSKAVLTLGAGERFYLHEDGIREM
jgi:hypothetical protein